MKTKPGLVLDEPITKVVKWIEKKFEIADCEKHNFATETILTQIFECRSQSQHNAI